jgi:hypothetical protein
MGEKKNLLECLPRLIKDKEHLENIAYAMRNHGPRENPLTKYSHYTIAATGPELPFLPLEDVRKALRELEAFEPGAARATLSILQD